VLTGRRLLLTIAGLVVLAALAVVAVVIGDDDDEPDGASATSATTLPEAASDEEVAGTLLPAVSALGDDWIETLRDDEPTEATIEAGDACPSGPVPEGFLIRSEQRRLQGDSIVETLSVTAGVVAEGATPADLEDPLVVGCLLDGLQAELPPTSTVAAVEGPELPAPPDGATVSHQRYEVTGAAGAGGTFDFVLVRRGRVVSLGLLSGFGAEASTDLADVVAVLDAPLRPASQRLD
jgi:hypothetical protein